MSKETRSMAKVGTFGLAIMLLSPFLAMVSTASGILAFLVGLLILAGSVYTISLLTRAAAAKANGEGGGG